MPRRAKPSKTTIPHKTYPYAYLKARNGVYYAVVHDKRVSTYTIADGSPQNIAIAMRRLEELLAARITADEATVNFHPSKQQGATTLMSAIEEYLTLKKRIVKPQSMETYINIFKVFKNDLPMDFKTIKDYIRDHLYDTDLHVNTKRQHLRTLRTFFEFCIDNDYLKKNPCKQFPPLASVKGAIRLPTTDEVQRLIIAAGHDTEYGRIIRLLAITGMRISEALALKVSDIKPDHIIIHGKGKRGHADAIRFFVFKAVPQAQSIAEECVRFAHGDKLFTVTRNAVGSRIRKLCKENNIEHLSPHDLRRYAKWTWEIQMRLPPHLCNLLAGHGFEVRQHYHRQPTVEDLEAYLE